MRMKKKAGNLIFLFDLCTGMGSDHYREYHLWSCQSVCDALLFLLDNIYIRFGTKLYRQLVGIPLGTNCAPLVADLFYSAMKEIS